jgi:hypothetical protein
MGLGSARLLTLAQARERAREARLKLLDKTDPLQSRRAERTAVALAAAKTLTFREASVQYYDQHASQWRNRSHAAQFLSSPSISLAGSMIQIATTSLSPSRMVYSISWSPNRLDHERPFRFE